MDIVSTQCGELYFCQVSSIFEHFHQKECLCSYPCIKSTLTENMRPFGSFQYVKDKGTWRRFGMRHLASHVHSLSYLRWSISRFESTMRTLILGKTKNGECIKEEPKQSHSANQYTSMRQSNTGKIGKTLLFWSGHISLSFSFSFKWFDDHLYMATVIKPPLEENGHNLQWIAPFKYLKCTFSFTFRQKKRGFRPKETEEKKILIFFRKGKGISEITFF
jgi:hypothetical protein